MYLSAKYWSPRFSIIVSTTLLSMGMLQLPPAMISLPFKILLFVMIDGWNLLVASLVRSFL